MDLATVERADGCLDAYDACGLPADGHSSLTTMTRSERRGRVTHVECHILLCSVRATLSLLQLLLGLAVLVHRYTQHLLLTTNKHALSRVGKI